MEFEFVDEDREAAEARVGQTFAGQWKLERLLGLGGMAAVYAARSDDGSLAALKILHGHLSHRKDIRDRFLREGLTANQVKHPGVVRVHDTRVDADGTAVLVMELLEGESLGDRHKRQPLALGELLDYLEQVLDALAVAHTSGIVHRDLKPDNLFLDRAGKVKILDFGIARVLDDMPGQKRTKTGMTLGTVPFMAPEQALGKRDQIDGRVDLFALGAMAFRILAGRNVHEAESPTEQLVAMASQAAPPLSSVAPEVPVGVCAVVDLALAFAKEARYPDAPTMRGDVRALRSNQAPPYATRLGQQRDESTRVELAAPRVPAPAPRVQAGVPPAAATVAEAPDASLLAASMAGAGAAPGTVVGAPDPALLARAGGAAHADGTVASQPSAALLAAAGEAAKTSLTTAAEPNPALLAQAAGGDATRVEAPSAELVAASRRAGSDAVEARSAVVDAPGTPGAHDEASRRRRLGLVAAVFVVLGLGGVALAVGSSSDSEHEESSLDETEGSKVVSPGDDEADGDGATDASGDRVGEAARDAPASKQPSGSPEGPGPDTSRTLSGTRAAGIPKDLEAAASLVETREKEPEKQSKASPSRSKEKKNAGKRDKKKRGKGKGRGKHGK